MKKQSLILLSISILGALAVAGTMAGNLLDTFYGAHAVGVATSTNNNFWGDSSSSSSSTDTSTSSTSTSSTSTSAGSSSSSATSSSSSSSVSSSTSSYSTTSVTYTTGKYTVLTGKSITYHLVEVKLAHTSHLRRNIVTNSSGSYGNNITATMSSQINTVTNQGYKILAAINGDSCYWGDGTDGYVIANGTTYSSNQRAYNTLDDFAIYKDFTVGTYTEASTSIDTVTSTRGGCWQSWGFGPALVKNGAVAVTSSSEIGSATSAGSNPRSAIGYLGLNHYYFLSTDIYGSNRQIHGCEFSLVDLGNFLLKLGCTYAYNLDGGGSASMYVASEGSGLVNNNTYSYERDLSDIIYVYE
jgi:exopolysaccharide biosynthesis protein